MIVVITLVVIYFKVLVLLGLPTLLKEVLGLVFQEVLNLLELVVL